MIEILARVWVAQVNLNNTSTLKRLLKYCNFINDTAYFISRYVPWIKSTVDYLEIDHTPRESDRSRGEHAKVHKDFT